MSMNAPGVNRVNIIKSKFAPPQEVMQKYFTYR